MFKVLESDSTIVGLVRLGICTWLLAKHFLPDFWFERAIGEYGQTNGVTSPGLFLRRCALPSRSSP